MENPSGRSENTNNSNADDSYRSAPLACNGNTTCRLPELLQSLAGALGIPRVGRLAECTDSHCAECTSMNLEVETVGFVRVRMEPMPVGFPE
jgi:hypothetical protein